MAQYGRNALSRSADSLASRLMRRLLTGDSLSLIEERNRRALANPLGKVKGIPIGKADAAMRRGFTDLFRAARSVNSVGRLVKINPDQADRVAGTGRDCELSVGSHAFELELRVVVIGGVLDDSANVVSSAWCRLLSAANRCRIESDQLVMAPECTNAVGRLVHLNPEHLPSGPTVGDVGNGYNRPGAVKCHAGVEQLDQLLAGVE